jgi:hypothetical protein
VVITLAPHGTEIDAGFDSRPRNLTFSVRLFGAGLPIICFCHFLFPFFLSLTLSSFAVTKSQGYQFKSLVEYWVSNRVKMRSFYVPQFSLPWDMGSKVGKGSGESTKNGPMTKAAYSNTSNGLPHLSCPRDAPLPGLAQTFRGPRLSCVPARLLASNIRMFLPVA